MLIKANKIVVGLFPKLAEKYQGPYFMSELGRNHTYKIRRCSNRKELKSFMDASQIKRYFDPAIVRTNTAQPQDLQFQDEQPVDTQDNVNSLKKK